MQSFNVVKAGGTSCGTPESLDAITDEVIRLHEESLRQSSDATTLFIVSATGSQKEGATRKKNTDLLEQVVKGENVETNISEIRRREDKVAQKYHIPEEVNQRHFNLLERYMLELEGERRYSRIVTSVGEILKRVHVAYIINSKRPGAAIDVPENSTGLYTKGGLRDARFDSSASHSIAEEFSRPDYRGKIAVIAGFTGIDRTTGELSTLERGGSDTSAVVYGAGLGVKRVVLYSDSILRRSDPRIVPHAEGIGGVTYAEMEEFIGFGSNLVAERANDAAERNLVELVLRDTFRLGEETIVAPRYANINGGIKGIAATDATLLVIGGLGTESGDYHKITAVLAKYHIPFTNEAGGTGESSMVLLPCIDHPLSESIGRACEEIKRHGFRVQVNYNDTRIGLIGQNVGNHPEIMAAAYNFLSESGIGVIASSMPANGKAFSIITEKTYADRVVRGLHDRIFRK